MPTPELLRAEAAAQDKKRANWKAMEGHLSEIARMRGIKATAQAKLDGVADAIAAVAAEKQGDLNTSSGEFKTQLTKAITRLNGNIAAQVANISTINDRVQVDDDYTATEKGEFLAAKTDEV